MVPTARCNFPQGSLPASLLARYTFICDLGRQEGIQHDIFLWHEVVVFSSLISFRTEYLRGPASPKHQSVWGKMERANMEVTPAQGPVDGSPGLTCRRNWTVWSWASTRGSHLFPSPCTLSLIVVQSFEQRYSKSLTSKMLRNLWSALLLLWLSVWQKQGRRNNCFFCSKFGGSTPCQQWRLHGQLTSWQAGSRVAQNDHRKWLGQAIAPTAGVGSGS